MVSSSSSPPRPHRLAWAVALAGLFIETLAVAGAALVAVGHELSGQADQARAGLGVALFYLVIAIGLAAVTHGVFRRRRWATAPAITVQLFGGLALGWPLVRAGHPLGYLLCGLAVVVAVALVSQARSLPRPRGVLQ